MGLDFDQLFPARFLKAGQFGGKDVTLQISKVTLEELPGKNGPEMRGILSFEKTPKQLVLNKTNGLSLKAMFGRDTGAWVGKRVTFYPAPIQFEDNDLAIRVRGSPDIAANVTFELKLARKKPRSVTLLKTGGKPAANAKPVPQLPATPPQQPEADASEEPPSDVLLPGQDGYGETDALPA